MKSYYVSRGQTLRIVLGIAVASSMLAGIANAQLLPPESILDKAVVNGIELNKSNPVITVAPGEMISGHMQVSMSNPCWNCILPVVGINSWDRTFFDDLGAIPGDSTLHARTFTFSFYSPDTPGDYFIVVFHSACYSAADNVYGCYPPGDPRKGVPGGGDDIWDLEWFKSWENLMPSGDFCCGKAIKITVQSFDVQKDFRFTDVDFVPMNPGPDGMVDTPDDIQMPAMLGNMLPDSNSNGKFDVRYIIKNRQGTVASTNPGQLYGVLTIKGSDISTINITDTFGSQFNVNPDKIRGGIEIIRVNRISGLATIITNTEEVTSVHIDNTGNTVSLNIDLHTPLEADESLMVYIKFKTSLKQLPPIYEDFDNEARVYINSGTGKEATASIEF
ncbi:MAG TPA: hypothetical protein HA257_05605, partial [Candidatus Methanoperedenaceae archaeon]|nr:hypothetical protein [Candidatus Methanoperedenaceae archaeon]